MTDRASRRRARTVRRVADTALDFAVGGTALAADKAVEQIDKVVSRATHDTDGRAYEDRTRDELYELAAERDIEGRSNMRKQELIAALRRAR